jgi:16S rRNA (guanine527-N7)-methyltransferase
MESREGLGRLLEKSGIEDGSEAAERLRRYLELLEKWNRRINLTASTDWTRLAPLFEEGIWAARLYPGEAATHLDIGSGAGFPAVVIGILVGLRQIDLIESRGRRAAFLETVAAELKLAGLRVHAERLDAYLRGTGQIWDCVTWKGVKLSREELALLQEHAHSGTQFWMFHGKDPSVDPLGAMERDFELVRTERFPPRRDWALSIYSLR